ncbi:MAG: ABC transporter substrate-binding protein [Candidatus Pristimantibacillus lignocellulolyticus]|uniref:ABC transporter substrate-binding protein n=1 Tax=Candidatus Pristimantibacillus lignocellulolyticus TaxID=2994561 RepID=A0A9J6Z8Y0_9BACL|nr:MAG: ABC transporter substrate-binding protein [Candidatus Pristimantibacillus lignocellulolyticus]
MIWTHNLRVKTFILLLLILSFVLISCESNNNDTTNIGPEEPFPVTLKMAIWNSDPKFIAYMNEKTKAFQEVLPHVTVEVEAFLSDSDYLQSMRVRSAASQLPDLFELKPNWLQLFEHDLIPLNEFEVTKRNNIAERFAVNEKIIAIPTSLQPEWVYYHPSVFDRLQLEIPQTWSEFITVLQAINEDGAVIPLALGAKDEWPTYPFNEFLPHLLSGNETYLSDMAKQSMPFGEETPFYTGYKKVAKLYHADIMGPDPLSVGWNDAVELFTSGDAAVLAAGQWFLPLYLAETGGLEDLDAFPLPYRDNENEPLRQMSFADHFLGISQESLHQEEAETFLTWYFSPENYKDYLDNAMSESVFREISSTNAFTRKIISQTDATQFIYLPGDEQYTRLSNAIQLDVKTLGQDMLVGRSVDQIATQLNERWKKAKGE